MEKAIRETFPKTEFVDGYQSVLMRAKEIKTQDEIACLKIANAITEAALDKALEFLRPGVRECEVLAVAWHTMTAMGSEWTQCSNIVASGPYTAPYRRFTSDRIIRNGDLVIIDIGACFNGYWGDLTRTWICGNVKPTPEMKDLHQKCYDALFNAGGAVIKPGATNADVFAQADPYVLDSLGHGAGVNPWEAPYFSPHSKDAAGRAEGRHGVQPRALCRQAGHRRHPAGERPHRDQGRRRHLHDLSVRRAPGERAASARPTTGRHTLRECERMERATHATKLPSFRLDGRLAVITGASEGIGRAFAARLRGRRRAGDPCRAAAPTSSTR